MRTRKRSLLRHRSESCEALIRFAISGVAIQILEPSSMRRRPAADINWDLDINWDSTFETHDSHVLGGSVRSKAYGGFGLRAAGVPTRHHVSCQGE